MLTVDRGDRPGLGPVVNVNPRSRGNIGEFPGAYGYGVLVVTLGLDRSLGCVRRLRGWHPSDDVLSLPQT